MQNIFSQLPEQFLKRCPRTGRIRGLRFDSIAAKMMFPILGILAIGWFLVRVIPKPSRAAYPCQQVAAGIGTGFLAYLAAMLATFTTFRFLHKRAGRAAAVAFMVALAVVCYHGMAVSKPAAEEKAVQILTPQEGPNKPMGKAKGIYPGRVVWEQDFAATSWDGESGRWWEDKNTDQGEIDKMFSKTLQSLTGAKSDKQAWESLFTYHNQSAGRGSRGYRKGEQVIVKLNCNADDGKPWDNRGYPAPKVVYALVRQLIENAGVPGGAIVLTDPSRMVGDNIYNKIRSNANADYQQVIFEGQNGGPAPQRVKPAPDMDDPIYFEMPGGKKATLYLPKSYAEATYMINYGLMRPHRVFGVTLAGKNHYGSVYDTELKIFKPTVLHAFALWDYPTPNKLGEAHGLPVLLGHKNTGGKTLLYFLDGLYTSYDQSRPVVKWASLNGRWFASILMSQDPIAMDSVAYDLITSEPNLTKGNPSFNGNVDNYLHESALADNPPSKAKYDPENDGKTLKTLGVHEHWNNATEKKYSRNLGRKEGIELIALK